MNGMIHESRYSWGPPAQPDWDLSRDWWAEGHALRKQMVPGVRRLAKLRATTGPGIYGKALVIHATENSAPCLSRSIADDLLANVNLRQSLWQAEVEGNK